MCVTASPSAATAGPDRLGVRVRRLVERRETIRYLVQANLRAGHRNKALGNLWNLLDPAASLAVYYLVFGVWLNQARGGATEYLIYLFTGVVAWRFLDGALAQSVNCIRSNRGLIAEINFPKAVFPLSICLSRLYDFVWGLLVLLAALLIAGRPPSWYALWLVPLIAVQLAMTVGLAYIVAYLGAFFADMANIMSVVLRLGFYASPILYYVQGPHATRIPPKFLAVYLLNPFAGLLESYRAALTQHSHPNPWHLLYVLGVALALLIAGYGLFSRGEGKFAKYV